MTVGVGCGPNGRMAEPAGDLVEVRTGLQGERRERVPQVVEALPRQAEAVEDALQVARHVPSVERRSLRGGEDEAGEGDNGLALLVLGECLPDSYWQGNPPAGLRGV